MNNEISEVIVSLDNFKEELIASINQIGSKYNLVPAVLIHILSEIVAEARSAEYRTVVNNFIQQNQKETTDLNQEEQVTAE